MFNDKKYALDTWTKDKIIRLEGGWLQQREGWYELIAPLLPPENDSVLDVGCGIGMYYPLLTRKSSGYIGLDPTEAMIERARERHPEGEFKIGSVYNISFPNNWFDLVFCWSVLVHLPHDTIEKAISELWRVTKKTLFLNLYVSLNDSGFSTTGPWGEFLTVMDNFWVKRMIRKLNPRSHDIIDYEGVDSLDEKQFQRKIFVLRKTDIEDPVRGP